jgi:hypothetical protein
MPHESHPIRAASGGAVLTEREAGALWRWVVAAKTWSEASQELVSDASELSTVSRDLADLLEDNRPGPSRPGPTPPEPPVIVDRATLAGDLRLLADGVEDQTAELRDRYLDTAADIDAYRSILD